MVNEIVVVNRGLMRVTKNTNQVVFGPGVAKYEGVKGLAEVDAIRFDQFVEPVQLSSLRKRVAGHSATGHKRITNIAMVKGDVVSIEVVLFNLQDRDTSPRSVVVTIHNGPDSDSPIIYEGEFVDAVQPVRLGEFDTDANHSNVLFDTGFIIPTDGTYCVAFWATGTTPPNTGEPSISIVPDTETPAARVYGGQTGGRLYFQGEPYLVGAPAQWNPTMVLPLTRLHAFVAYNQPPADENLGSMLYKVAALLPNFVGCARLGVYNKTANTMELVDFAVADAAGEAGATAEEVWAYALAGTAAGTRLARADDNIEDGVFGLDAAKVQRDGIAGSIAGLNDITPEDVWALEVVDTPVYDAKAALKECVLQIMHPSHGLVNAQASRVEILAAINQLNNISVDDVWNKLVGGTQVTMEEHLIWIGDYISSPTWGLVQAKSQRDGIQTGVLTIISQPDWGMIAAQTQRDTIEANMLAYHNAVMALLGNPTVPTDTVFTLLETISSEVAIGLGERVVNQDGFYDASDIFHPNGSGPVTDGTLPLDDVQVYVYAELPGTGKWTHLFARTTTTANGKWATKLDDGIYILWFYRADRLDILEWRAISPDGSVENPTTDPRGYI